MKMVTGWDIAKAAGVSQATVSRVMVNSSRIGRDTRKRVLEAARKLGYDMCPSSGDWTVGVIVAPSTHNYYSSLHWAMTQEIMHRGLRMELIPDDSPKYLDYRPVRGLVDLRLGSSSYLPEFPVPMVRINCDSIRSKGICAVRLDGEKEASIAARYLLRNGHRNIRFISFEGEVYEKNKLTRRWPGFVKALREGGIEDPENCGIFFEPHWNRKTEDVVAALSRAMEEGCTGIICVNSFDTLKVNKAVHTMKLKLPEELSIVDWEYENVSEYLNPPRTTVAIRFRELASEALTMLTQMLELHESPPDRLVPPELIIRESVRNLTQKPIEVADLLSSLKTHRK